MGRGRRTGCKSENLPEVRIAYQVSRDWDAAQSIRISGIAEKGGYRNGRSKNKQAVASNAEAAAFFIAPTVSALAPGIKKRRKRRLTTRKEQG